MRKAIIAFGLTAALALPFALVGCGGDSGNSGDKAGDAKQEQAAPAEEKAAEPGIVSLDNLKAGTKIVSETQSMVYEDCVAAFGNEGALYKDSDNSISYRWETEDKANSILITFWKTDDDKNGKMSGMSWSGDEIKAYKDTLG